MDLDRRRWLAAAALSPLAAALACPRRAAAAPRDALPVELARTAPSDLDPAGWLVSEKLDGVRALWDGSRLVFRSGLPVVAPRWFTERLPPVRLDGELWIARGQFEALSGVVRRFAAVDVEWRAVRYEVFDLPGTPGPFAERAARLARVVRDAAFAPLQAIEQRPLTTRAELMQRFEDVVRGGGEGLVLHRADAPWRPGRGDALLKMKPLEDAEAIVVAHVPGRGRLEGRLGALQVRTPEGVEFLLGTGLTDAERARPPTIGSHVTYRYRSVTASGVPRFASFLRVRDPARG